MSKGRMWTLILLGLCVVGAADRSSSKDGKKPSIHASDVGGDAQIIGRLGLPLGRVTAIEGVVVDPEEYSRTKGYDTEAPQFDVQRVDGKALGEPVRVVLRTFSFERRETRKPDRRATLIGYEDGEFRGIPGDALKLMKSVPQTATWHLAVHFKVLKVTFPSVD